LTHCSGDEAVVGTSATRLVSGVVPAPPNFSSEQAPVLAVEGDDLG
jgi:hypothetical protein